LALISIEKIKNAKKGGRDESAVVDENEEEVESDGGVDQGKNIELDHIKHSGHKGSNANLNSKGILEAPVTR